MVGRVLLDKTYSCRSAGLYKNSLGSEALSVLSHLSLSYCYIPLPCRVLIIESTANNVVSLNITRYDTDQTTSS